MAELFNSADRERLVFAADDNIDELRAAYPDGLHFVVGDTHGETATAAALMEKIRFDPGKDRVYFVGDYNSGGNVRSLLGYLAAYYTEDGNAPGIHLIRGNHERELDPIYPLENLPDILVLKGERLNYYIVHAGMISSVLELLAADTAGMPAWTVSAYRLTGKAAGYDGPLRQITWSRYGLYSQRFRPHIWPSEERLHVHRACILHGHTPFCMLKKGGHFTYGDRGYLWNDQRVWFSEDLQSFDLDSNMKGRYDPEDRYRGLSCVCLETLEEAAALSRDGSLTIDSIRLAHSGIFGVPHRYGTAATEHADPGAILTARPAMKTITVDAAGRPYIESGRERCPCRCDGPTPLTEKGIHKLRLEKITPENVWKIVNLRVGRGQEDFVSSNAESLIEAYAAVTNDACAYPFGLYDGEHPVGFLMIGFDGSDCGEDRPPISRGNYSIWRLMIDERYRHRGYGRQAVALALDFIRTFPCGSAEYCYLSYEPENVNARKLYAECGFAENGEMDGDELVAVLRL